jgi:hypothetical protein
MGFDLGSLIPAALGFAVGGPLGASLGLEGTAASVAGGALAGGLGSAALGGNFVSGALGGGLGGYGGTLGSFGALGAAPGAAVDPLGAYLTGGGVDGSVVSGAGGYGGAISGVPETAALSGSFPDMMRQRMAQLGFLTGGGGTGAGLTGGGLSGGLRQGLGALQLAGGLQQYQAQSERQAQQQGYARQMQQLMANPSSVESLPGYQAGLRAVERRGRAEGFGGSGSMAAALAGYGGQQYQQQLSNLAALQGSSQPVGSPMMGLVGAGLGAYNLFG